MIDLIDESKRLAAYIINTCSGSSGLLMDKIDVKENIAHGKCMINDLGDYVPFFYWLGKKSDKKYCEWAENQVKLAIKYCRMPNNFFDFSLSKNADLPLKKSDYKLIKVSEHGDAILGLVAMYEISGKNEFREYAEDFFKALTTYAIAKNGLIYSHVYPALNLKIPLSAGTYSGLFIEELSRFYKLTGDESYLTAAMRIGRGWIDTNFFKKYGLFSFEILTSSPFTKFVLRRAFRRMTSMDVSTAMAMKSNTNIVYGLIELYSIKKEEFIKNAIIKWTESLQERLMDKENRFYTFWHPVKGKGELSIEVNHTLIDVLIELFSLLEENRFLQLAEKCADSWLSMQARSGLMPCGHNKPVPLFDMSGDTPQKIYLNPTTSILDCQTDFCIALLKLYSKTHETKYYKSAENILNGILEMHRFGEGYVKFVNTQTGAKFGYTTETKFLTLLLKLFLFFSEIEENRERIQNKKIRNLVRDR